MKGGENMEGKYSYRTMWLFIAIWTTVMVWISYVAHEIMHWNGLLWFTLLVTYVAVVLPITAYSDIKF